MINLLWISLSVALIFNSGFWDALDGYINARFRFYHLPHLLQCALCQTWWLSLLFIIITGNLSLFNIFLCLINAHLANIWMPMLKVMENWLYKAIEWLMPK